MKLKRLVATLLTVVVLMGLLPMTMVPASAAGKLTNTSNKSLVTGWGSSGPTQRDAVDSSERAKAASDINSILCPTDLGELKKEYSGISTWPGDIGISAQYYYYRSDMLYTGFDKVWGFWGSAGYGLYVPTLNVVDSSHSNAGLILACWSPDTDQLATKIFGLTTNSNVTSWHYPHDEQYVTWLAHKEPGSVSGDQAFSLQNAARTNYLAATLASGFNKKVSTEDKLFTQFGVSTFSEFLSRYMPESISGAPDLTMYFYGGGTGKNNNADGYITTLDTEYGVSLREFVQRSIPNHAGWYDSTEAEYIVDQTNDYTAFKEAIKLAFGPRVLQLYESSGPVADLAGLTLNDQYALLFLLAYAGPSKTYSGSVSDIRSSISNNYAYAFLTKEEREANAKASATELLTAEQLSDSSHEYKLIRDAANRYSTSGYNDTAIFNALLKDVNSPLGFATDKNIGCPTFHPYTNLNSKILAISAYQHIAYYPDDYVNTPIQYTSAGPLGDVGAKGMAIMAADSQYLQLSKDNPLFESAKDIRTHAERWALHMRIAYGLTFDQELSSSSTLGSWKFYGLDTCILAVPPACIDTNTNVNFGGFEALILSINELPNMSTTIVTALANYVSTEGKDFTAVREEIAAMRSIYETLSWFDDANLWEFWTSNVFDHRQGIEDAKRVSLKDVYDYLVANNAFSVLDDDGTDNDLNEDFGYFFSSVGELSNSIKTGVKVSAAFLPMHTNVYNPETWDTYVDTGWLLNYYAKFGYFRKALYIDTAADAASSWVNTRGRGQLAVATLDDLLQDKDIVLYLDDNLYNVDDLAELVNMSWDRLGQGEGQSSLGTFESWGAAISDLWSLSMPELAKTGERTAYSQRVDMSKEKWQGFFFSNKAAAPDPSPSPSPDPAATSAAPADPSAASADQTTTTAPKKTSGAEDDITMYLWPDEVWDTDTNQLHGTVKDDDGNVTDTAATTEYTPLFAFAVLSAIYRDESKALMRGLNQTLSSNNPVFISSASAPYMGRQYSHLIFNYMLTRNLEYQIEVDYAASLDMTSPLYMDVFGNILTESGYVVIPAAANATLWDYEKYKPYNAAFCTCYGDNFLLPSYQDEVDSEGKLHINTDVGQLLAGGSVQLCTLKDGVWYLNSIEVMSGEVDLAKISTASKDSLQDVVDTWGYTIQTGGPGLYDINLWRMLITEVLRGAPIESIDKQFEGIQTDVNYTRNGLIIADKLETLCNAIAPAGQNASLAIPNPAFIDGIEIIVFFVYKLLILAVLIIWMVNVYLDATGGVIGIKTGLKCIGVVVLVLALIVGVPKVFELSYYESNKHLLQDETEYLLMLNTEKKANGQEIGVSKVRPPETSTTLYLHLADIDMPWWDILPNIGLSAGYKSLDEMYKDYANRHPLAYTEYATTMNDGVYISVDQLFSSAVVQFSPLSHRMYLRGDDNTPASYYTPYYYFLNMLVQDISDWSKGAGGAVAYTTKVQKGGELKTLGYCKLYFASEDFLEEGGDYFHLYDLYGVTAPRTFPGRYSLPDDQMEMVRQSQWCSFNNGQMSEKGYIDRINKLQTYAQEWIANNHVMIGRISDETFLKCFALSCAMEHNRLFNTQRADYLEIQQLSNEDLLRLSIADHNQVMSNSSMSYARFVYTTGGTIACYLAAILELVNLVSSWVKPACTLLVFCIACISIFVLKLILRKGNNSIMGYILTISLMCSVNVLGAAVTKLSMFLPNTGLTPSLCILLQVLVQIGYIFLQLKIVSFAMRDWRNIGYQQYEHQFNKLHLPGRRSENISRNVLTPRGFTGYDELDRLNNRKLGRRIRK